MRVFSLFLISILLASTCSADVIRCHLSDANHHPIGDAPIYVDCRDNYFFTDIDGVAMIYVESDYIDCILEVTHADFLRRRFLVKLSDDSDTSDVAIRLTRPGEIEQIIPGDDLGRFSRIQPCGPISQFECVVSSNSGGNAFVVRLTPDQDGARVGFMLTLDAGEIEAIGSENGYDLNSAEKVVFSARSVTGANEALFMSLISDCDASAGSCPAVHARLTDEYTRFEIDLSRWRRNNVNSILGCMLNTGQDNFPVEIEISNLGILHSESRSVSDASAIEN